VRESPILVLLGLLGFWSVVSLLGGWITAWSVDSWYPGLVKPWFNPPPWVFAPVWTTLYVLLALAGFAVWRGRTGAARPARTFWLLYAANGVANVAWSLAFFGLRSVAGGLAVIVPLLALVALLAREGYRQRPLAAWLLLPYLAWASFATLLNATLLALNPGL
jgi:tryptophan-rich sensory protein